MKNLFNAAKRGMSKCVAVVAGTAASGTALAQTSYDPVVNAADWTDVGTGIATIGGALAVVLVIMTGVALLLSRIRNR